ncbi:MAG: putative toxin-antitoxin system toxin component, PIN family [Patescibacteria group bacterium]
MCTVVIDTNVLIAATEDLDNAARGAINLVNQGEITACASRPILDEYQSLIPQRVAAEEVCRELQGFFARVKLVRLPRHTDPARCEDQEDEKFVQCARAVDADYLITQDRHLLDLENIGTTHVVTPQKFLLGVKHMKDPAGKREWAAWVRQIMGSR